MPVSKSYLEKIDPQMWLTLIGFVFTLGIIYGEFQTMKNKIYQKQLLRSTQMCDCDGVLDGVVGEEWSW